MAEIIKCVNRAEAEDVIKKLKKKTEVEVVLASAILKPKFFKSVHVTRAPYLIPNPYILTGFLETGNKDIYHQEYLMQLKKPDIWWMINTIMSTFINHEKTLIFVCSDDERDYKYMKYLMEMIEDTYNIKIISCDKFFDGKHTKYNDSEVITKVEKINSLLVNKLKDVGLNPMDIFIKNLDKKSIKDLPDKLKKKIKKYMEE